MIVISDSSVLINLAWVKQLELLPHLYGEVIVPTAVWQEVVEQGIGKPGAEELKTADWIQVKEPVTAKQKKMLTEIKSSLDSLRQQAGFYISEPLYRRILRDADEKPEE